MALIRNNMNRKTIILAFAASLLFLSCSIERMIVVPYNEGIMTEYQYRQDDKELVITFQRNSRTKCISSIMIKSNRSFIQNSHVQGYPHSQEENFIVNIDSLNIVMGGKKMLFDTMSSRKDVHQIKVEDKVINLQILPNLITKDSNVLQIIPSNFIMDNNNRVISDTLRIRTYGGD